MTTATDAITTFIVDDQQDVRMLIRILVETANDGLEVAGEASSGAEAIQQVDDIDPVVVVFDEMMPKMTGTEAAARIRERRPAQLMILCSAYLDQGVLDRARAVGFDAWLPKEDVVRLPDLIRQVVARRVSQDAPPGTA